MKGPLGGKRVLGALSVLLLLFAVGCGKKELVKSTDTAPGMTSPPGETQAG
ncbi:MAG: hypothetical protein HKM29_05350, partial [Deltaproteobacteria bacterium]|nr:hypothetical protein [Deltaproteobacteria bacterium]